MAGVRDKSLLIFHVADFILYGSSGDQAHYNTADDNAGADQSE